jgi:hypothetical protein
VDGEERGVNGVLVGTPEGKRPLGRHRGRWEDNIRMDLPEVGCEGMDWIGLAYPASCTMGTGSFPGVKRPGIGADHPRPPSAEVENE